jgi:hypothetical protein
VVGGPRGGGVVVVVAVTMGVTNGVSQCVIAKVYCDVGDCSYRGDLSAPSS